MLSALRHRIRHLTVTLMLAAMMAFVAHGPVLGGAHVAAATHGYAFGSSQSADHGHKSVAISPDQVSNDLAAAHDGDGPERSTHAHCPLCCAGACAVAQPVGAGIFNIRTFRASVVRFDSEVGHGIEPDGPRRPPRATLIA